MKSFSIIIPYFNSNNFIEKAIRSILDNNYDMSKIEIIVIDDGSTDKNFDKIYLLIEENKNIKFFKKSNGQWGSVINFARKNNLVNNDYVGVLDSDDFYDKNCFSNMNELQNSDLICGSFRFFDGKKYRRKLFPSYNFFTKRVISDKNKMKTPFCLPLPFFVRKEIFYKINDLVELIPYQDGPLLSQYIYNSSSFSFTKKIIGFYYFNREGNSSTSKWDSKRIENTILTCEEYLKYDNQEFIFYRLLFNKEFRINLKERKYKFKIKRKFYFSFWPWYIRWFVILLFNFAFKKYFIFEN